MSNNQAAYTLEPITFPLHGTRLIEASAGTGKTFTIAALYLRLVLGHGSDGNGHGRPLLPQEILVVTFTKAATEELKDRIRARLVEGAACFRGLSQPDAYLAKLMADFPPEEHPYCALLLEQAAQLMDLAAVHTIHGWCQRMLREHAFDSGSLFELEMQSDTLALQLEAVQDYWRRFFYIQPRVVAQKLNSLYADPDALLNAVRPLLGLASNSTNGPEPEPFSLFEQYVELIQQAKTRCRELWPTFSQQLSEAISKKWLKGNIIKLNQLDMLNEWLEGDAPMPDDKCKRYYNGTFSEALSAAGKKQTVAVLGSDVLSILENLALSLAKLELRPALLRHSSQWIAARVAQVKKRKALLDFDDLIKDLGAALEREHQAGGDKLAAAIRHQYPVALIDEFQDTDPVQYGLFQRLYLQEPQLALLMIGDPKQAIYSFRGADLHTYLQARRDTSGRHYTLETNYRSTHDSVAATNALFALGNHNPKGVFHHQQEIPYLAVNANGRQEVLLQGDTQIPAMTLWWDEHPEGGVFSGGEYQTRQAAYCAEQITALLNGSHNGEVALVRDGQRTAVVAADLAILVRSYVEAKAVRVELAKRGVRSVYLSDKDSVFASDEAQALLRVLQAVAQPSERNIKAALATKLLGFSWSALDDFNRNEQSWERELNLFRDLNDIWQLQGVLPMVRRLLAHYGIAKRSLADPQEGERTLTNVLHLAELLQSASSQLDGQLALIRFLAEQRESSTLGDEQILRLESDAALVKIVTIHKSKGLEYPIVFLPFIAGFKAAKERNGILFYRDENGQKALSFEPTDEQKASADAERLEEDLRLLYVALTRARHACYLGLAAVRFGNTGPTGVNNLSQGGIGNLLGAGEAQDNAALRQALQDLAAQHQGICVLAPPSISEQPLQLTESTSDLIPPPLYRKNKQQAWWITSYSAMLSGMSHGDSALSERLMEVQAETEQPVTEEAPTANSIHSFPKGAKPGTFLHDLFEWAAQAGQAAQGAGFGHIDAQLLQAQIQERCDNADYSEHSDMLCQWFTEALQLPLALDNANVSLADLDQVQAEMEFMLPTHKVDVAELDQLVRQQVWPYEARPELKPNQLNGMLKGFIDLTFRHGERYYVADYKSNYLGVNETAYTAQAMRRAMLEHRYDLQAVLYTLALHRLLRARLPDYQFERHIGGGIYLFLRGMSQQHMGNGVISVPISKALIEQLDSLFRGEKMQGQWS